MGKMKDKAIEAMEKMEYHRTIADFADLVKHVGVYTIMYDMEKYQEEATELLRGYFADE